MDEVVAWIVGIAGLVLPGFGQRRRRLDRLCRGRLRPCLAASAGIIETVAVRQGDEVAAGDVPLVPRAQHRALFAASASPPPRRTFENLRLAAARTRSVIRASLQKAEADLDLASRDGAALGPALH